MPSLAAPALDARTNCRPQARDWRSLMVVVALGIAVDASAKKLAGRLPLGSSHHVVGPLALRHVEHAGIELRNLPAGHVIPVAIGVVILALTVCFGALADVFLLVGFVGDDRRKRAHRPL